MRCWARYVFLCSIYFICQKSSHRFFLIFFSVIEDIKKKGAFISLLSLVLGKSLMFCTCTILVPRGCAPFGQHQESRPLNLWPVPIPEVRDPVTLRMLRVKSDNSDWFRSHSIVFPKPIRTRIYLDLSSVSKLYSRS